MNVQERLQLKRIPLDKWSTREQLCLAMAVLCSGDQNWMSVSRALKMMCGANRPTDWFSQKFCAAQYGKLLENVETPKRKKRTAMERDNPSTTDTIVPGELIVRKLVQERNAELKKLVEDGQREYRQLANEIRLLQSDSMDDAQVLAMWEQIENENRDKEKEQQKHAQWLKEREERKIEMERAWRPGAVSVYQNVNSMSPTSNSNSSGSPSRSSPSLSLKINQTSGVGGGNASGVVKLEPVEHLGDVIMAGPETPVKQGTSPLLTSLLKSPSSNPSTPTQSQAINTRSLAPTITTLLTSGQQAINTNSPAITINMPPNQASSTFFNFHSPHPQHQLATNSTAPSKAAPTLSKLLDASRKNEGNATAATAISVGGASGGGPATSGGVVVTEEDAINMDDDQQLMEVFKELMPDDLADILTDNNEMIVSPELLDQDLDHVSELLAQNAGTRSGGGGQVATNSAHVVNLPPPSKVAGLIRSVEVKQEILEQPPTVERKAEVVEEVAVGASGSEELKVVRGTASKNDLTERSFEGFPEGSDKVNVKEEMEEKGNDIAANEQEHNTSATATTSELVSESDNVNAENPVDNLEEQLAAITNEENSHPEEPAGNASEIISQEFDDPQEGPTANDSATEKTETDPEQHDGAGSGVAAMVEEDHMEEEKSKEPESEVLADSEEMEVEEKTESVEAIVEKPIEEAEEEPESITVVDDSADETPLPPPSTSTSVVDESILVEDEAKKIEERKCSTDNEDQFEDAKSTVGADSGNPPEDVEMPSSAKDVATEEVKVKAEKTDQMEPLPMSEHRSSRSRRDMPKRNRSQVGSAQEGEKPALSSSLDRRHLEDSGEETKSSSASNLSAKTRLKERDRSESPLVMDEDTSDVIPRTRRRYSSTPVIDSVPSSPASGDDREYKNWKKTVLIAFNQFSTLHYKYSAVLVQQVPEEFRHIILRPMDMQTIKKNIETGVYRTTMEFQRDILLMVQNAIMMNTRRDRDWTNLINEMMVEVDYWKRETEKNLNSRESDASTGGGSSRDGQGKVRNRKSMRITTTS